METISGILTFLAGMLIRLGIPVLITVALIWIYRLLDERWQAEAEQLQVRVPVVNSGCWKVNGCSEQKREKCPAYQHQEIPCWQVYRSESGKLKERCVGCKVFKEAPIPVIH